MGDNKPLTRRTRKKFKHPVNEYGARNFMSNGFYPSRNGNTNYAYNEGRNVNYFSGDGAFTDYADFPAMRYYLNKYEVYPSSLQYDCSLSYSLFIEKIDEFKKMGFYCESLKPVKSFAVEVEIERDFICFEDEKNKIVVYITINDFVNKTTEDERAFTVIGVFNPCNNPDSVLTTIKDGIIGLPLIERKDGHTGELYILVSDRNGFSLEAKRIDAPEIDFKELEASRSKLLSEKLGVNISGKHTLADIYNAEEQSFTKKNNQIGFKAATA